MATFDQFITCDNNTMSLEALLKSLEVVHDDGRKGYRVMVVNIAECDDLNDRECNDPKTLEQGFRERIALDPCGKPAILVFNTVAAS